MMKNIKRLLPILLILVIMLGLTSCGDKVDEVVYSQPEYPVNMDEVSDVLLKDAQFYADSAGLTLDEAVRRLVTSDLIGEIESEIIAHEPSYAGIWIQHEPEYRFVFAFTENGEDIIKRYVDDPNLLAMIDVLTFEYTIDELIDVRELMSGVMKLNGIACSDVLNMQNNTVDFYCADKDEALAIIARNNVDIPGSVRLLQDEGLEIPDDILTPADREADATNLAALTGSSWKAVVVAGETVPSNAGITLQAGQDGILGGYAGCNSYGGHYNVKGFQIRIGSLDKTDVGCREGLLEFEKSYVKSLGSARTFTIEGNYMTFYDANGDALVVFLKDN